MHVCYTIYLSSILITRIKRVQCFNKNCYELTVIDSIQMSSQLKKVIYLVIQVYRVSENM